MNRRLVLAALRSLKATETLIPELLLEGRESRFTIPESVMNEFPDGKHLALHAETACRAVADHLTGDGSKGTRIAPWALDLVDWLMTEREALL